MSRVCKHICACLLMIGVKNNQQEGDILTKCSYSKVDRKRIDHHIDQMKNDQTRKTCDNVLEELQSTIQEVKKEEVITELPFINLKEVISKHDSYAEALKEITSNDEFSPKWYGIVTNNGRYQCPGSVHTERCQVTKGSVAVIADFFSVRKTFYQFIIQRDRRYFCCNKLCISSYGPTSLNRFSNLKPPDTINSKYLDTKQANTLRKLLPDITII